MTRTKRWQDDSVNREVYAFAERKYSASMDNKTTTIEQAFFDGGFFSFSNIFTAFVTVEYKM